MKFLLALLLVPAASGSAIFTSGFYERVFPRVNASGWQSYFDVKLSDGYPLIGESHTGTLYGFCYIQFGQCQVLSDSPSYDYLTFNYTDDAPVNFRDTGDIKITTDNIKIPLTFTSGSQTFYFPFTASGLISTTPSAFNPYPPCDLPTPDFISPHYCTENLTGSGIEAVTVGLYLDQPNLGSYYNIDRVVFTFVAPEPSTMAFCTIAGLAAVCRRRKRT
jgi:hypothetical protein